MLLPLSLFFLAEYPPAHLEDCFKSFAASFCILIKAFQNCLFDFRLDLLDAATQGGYLSILLQLGSLMAWSGGAKIRFIDHRFSDTHEITPGQVCRAHRHAFGRGRYVGCFVDVRYCRFSKQCEDPGRSGLSACNQAFCPQLDGMSQRGWQWTMIVHHQGERGNSTMPVDGSTSRERVSTAMT